MRAVRVLCVVIAAVTVVALAACAPLPSPEPSRVASQEPITWERLPSIPDGSRGDHTLVWTGEEIIVLGGRSGGRCPDNADCAFDLSTPVTSALAFDVDTDRWRTLAEMPRSTQWATAAYAAGIVYVVDRDGLLTYDVESDVWEVVDVSMPTSVSVTTFGSSMLFCSRGGTDGSPYRLLNTLTGRWSELPEDPLGAGAVRECSSTPFGIVVTASPGVWPPPDTSPLLSAALWDGRSWTRLDDGDQLGPGAWIWTGTHLIDPALGVASGESIELPGRDVTYGGVYDLPDGTWAPLDSALTTLLEESRVSYALGERWSSISGYLYDDLDGTWTAIRHPVGIAETGSRGIWADGELYVVGGYDNGASPDIDAYVDTVYRGTPAD